MDKEARNSLVAIVGSAIVLICAMLLRETKSVQTDDSRKGQLQRARAVGVTSTNGESSEEGAILPRFIQVEGRVIDSESSPVEGAQVDVVPAGGSVRTLSDGTFSFQLKPSYEYTLFASKGDAYGGPTQLGLLYDDALVVITMHRGTTLIIHAEAGRAPATSVEIVVDARIRTATDETGVAHVSGLSPGLHMVDVRSKGWAPMRLGVSIGQDPGGVIERFVVLSAGAPIDGIVLDPDTRPLGDASIVFWNASDGGWVQETTSHRDGRWHIDALPRGRYRVVASAPGYLKSAEVIIECDGRLGVSQVELRVNTGAQISGIVLDTEGKSVSDARVIVMLHGRDYYELRTDRRGRFALAGLSAGTYVVAAQTSTQASTAVQTEVQDRMSKDLELTLSDSRISGKVVDETGQPLADVRIEAQASSGSLSTTPERTITSDHNGEFCISGLEPGEYFLHGEWPAQWTPAPQSEARDPVRTGTKDAVVVLPNSGSIVGRVLLDGQPLEYFGVLLSGAHIPTGIQTIDGRLQLKHVTPGNYVLKLLAPTSRMTILKDLTIGNGRVLDLGNINLQRGQRIMGVVRDMTGAAIKNARVIIGRGPFIERSRLEHWFWGEYETTTDEHGRYVFDGVDIESDGPKSPRLYALHPRYGASLAHVIPPGDQTIELELIGAGVISGIVQDTTTSGVFIIRAERLDEPAESRWTTANYAGEFRFENVPPGDYMLTASRGSARGPATPVVVHVTDGGTATTTVVSTK